MTPKELQKLLEKEKLKLGYQVRFPQYNILPDEVILALKILQNHKMVISVTVEPLP